MHFKRCITVFFLITLHCFLFPKNAYAYLDPGSGSYIFQLIMGVLLGGVFAVTVFWKKMKIFFKRIFYKGQQK